MKCNISLKISHKSDVRPNFWIFFCKEITHVFVGMTFFASLYRTFSPHFCTALFIETNLQNPTHLMFCSIRAVQGFVLFERYRFYSIRTVLRVRCRVLQVGLDKKCGAKVRWKSAVEGRKKSHTLILKTFA